MASLPRKNYARIPVKLGLPNLIDIQLDSFERLKREGLGDLFHEVRHGLREDGEQQEDGEVNRHHLRHEGEAGFLDLREGLDKRDDEADDKADHHDRRRQLDGQDDCFPGKVDDFLLVQFKGY